MAQKLQWKPVKTGSENTSRPCPRWGHSSCTIDDEIVLFGGYANSTYMNDMWIFNTITMDWTQLKINGLRPTPRSNCSLNYDHHNGKLILFGGGGENKRRFNEIYVMDWKDKQWTCIAFAEKETAPWERTYHSAELLYPYLITFGGEGIADLDDLWVFNFETKKWQEVTFARDALRPCGRRFHTSCIVGNQFFVIAGCYSKYRPLNDVYSIDLTKLKETGSVEGLEWKQRLNDQGFLTRWGHSSTVQGNNIYIFGGRFSNDLNDVLVLDTQKDKIKTLKVSAESIPKPRRRSCLNFIGNCLLMFGGFNTDYYNDLHFINVTEINPKSNLNFKNWNQKSNLINDKQLSDLKIKAKNGEYVYCHKGILMQNFICQRKLYAFLEKIEGREQYSQLLQMLEDVYNGYGTSKLLTKYLIDIPETQSEQKSDLLKKLSTLRQVQSTSQQNQKPQKLPTYKVQSSELDKYLEQLEQSQYKDLTLIIHSTEDNEYFSTSVNKMVLAQNSKFFKNLMSEKFKNEAEFVEISVPCEQVYIMRAILAWLYSGALVVDAQMGCREWINLYKLADYFCLPQIKLQALVQLYYLLSSANSSIIFNFAQSHNLEDLALTCSRLRLSSQTGVRKQVNENKYMRKCFEQNRFQIRQQGMTKNIPFMCKKINSSTQDMEVDKQNNGETSCVN